MSADWAEGPLPNDGIAALRMAVVLFGTLWFGGYQAHWGIDAIHSIGLLCTYLFWWLLIRHEKYFMDKNEQRRNFK